MHRSPPSFNKFLLFVIPIVIITIILVFPKSDQNLLIPIAGFIVRSTDKKVPDKRRNNLKEVVTQSLLGTTGTYAVVVKNFKTDESFFFNDHRKFATGSLYKLWVMASTFDLIKQGKLGPDEVLSADVADINDKFNIDPDYAELTDGQISMTVFEAINQMITISHNYSALMLTDKVGTGKISEDLKKYNLSESNLGDPPLTTAYDIALFFEKLYHGQIVDPEYSRKMVDILSNQKRTEGIPKYLPRGLMVAHKTGEIDFYKHNAGLIYSPDGDYLIVVLSESMSPFGAEERIALLSKDVFDYFNRK